MGFFQKLFGSSEPPKSEAPKAPETWQLFAPVAGEAVALSEVSDPTFGEEILGKGMAIKPGEGKVFAPCDATVDMMFETGHAVSLVTGFGAEVLIHVGLDTVNLKGEHYTIHAKAGDKVKKGDLLIEFDKDAIAAAGYDTITPVIICNTPDYASIVPHTGSAVTNGDVVLELTK